MPLRGQMGGAMATNLANVGTAVDIEQNVWERSIKNGKFRWMCLISKPKRGDNLQGVKSKLGGHKINEWIKESENIRECSQWPSARWTRLPPSHILRLCVITSRHVLVLASGYLVVETVPHTAGENHNLPGSPEANTVAVTKCISC